MKEKIKKVYYKILNIHYRVIFMKCVYYVICKPIIFLMRHLIKMTNDKYIIFESRPDYDDNSRVLSEYLIEHGYNEKYHITWLVDKVEDFKKYETKNVHFVRKFGKYDRQRTLRAYYYTLRSKYVFFTHALRWASMKNKGQVYINLWHGCGFKDSRGDEGKTNVFDYVLVPGPVFIKTKQKFFGCDESKILPIGYPRYDLLKKKNEHVDDLLASFNPEANKTILWMPTFRDSDQLLHYDDPIPFILGLPLMHSVKDFEKVDQMCKAAGVNLVIKWHRNSKGSAEAGKVRTNLFDLSNDDLAARDIQLYEFIGQTDALITDYSSVAIDYMLLDKPIGFTMDDYHEYEKTRGFVFDNAKDYMAGEHLYNLDDLEQFIKHVAVGQDLTREKREHLMPEVHNLTDDYCKRILDEFEITLD